MEKYSNNNESNLTTKEILNNNPQFRNEANKISTILGYNKKFYALGLTDINKEGEYKGHANNSTIDYWHDYGRFENYIDFLRQIDLHLENKIDKYTGGKDETNYNIERAHYILFETRVLKNEKESNGTLHIDDSGLTYMYETGTRQNGAIDINNSANGQMAELIESMRLPQGSITKRFYLKHSRECPIEEFYEAFKMSKSLNSEISKLDTTDNRKVQDFFNSHSYKTFTDIATFIDKEKYDYVKLPNDHLVVINEDILVDPKEIAEKELTVSENKRLEEMYEKYVLQDKSNTVRGSENDLKQFTLFLQSI
jgi:hypothetical protein